MMRGGPIAQDEVKLSAKKAEISLRNGEEGLPN
jgi:hypothetical protein